MTSYICPFSSYNPFIKELQRYHPETRWINHTKRNVFSHFQIIFLGEAQLEPVVCSTARKIK